MYLRLPGTQSCKAVMIIAQLSWHKSLCTLVLLVNLFNQQKCDERSSISSVDDAIKPYNYHLPDLTKLADAVSSLLTRDLSLLSDEKS